MRGFGECRAIGVGIGGTIVAGFVYFNWFPEARTIEMGLAADTPRWATRSTIRALLAYAFVTCNAQRITLVTSEANDKAIKVALGTGFKREALIERAYGPNENAVLFRQFVEEWQAGPFRLRIDHADEGQRAESA